MPCAAWQSRACRGGRAAEVFYRSPLALPFLRVLGAMGVGMAAFCLWIVVRQGH